MYKRQKYIEMIVPFINKPVIKVITGMRRSGKSTAMLQLIDYIIETGIDKERIVYLNMESLDNEHLLDVRSLNNFVKEQMKKAGAKIFLFIDEVQEIPEWEKGVNSFFANQEADIFITGSNSKLLSGELATLLSGRYVEFFVQPLVFSEYAMFRSKKPDRELFNEYLKYGGMPGIHHLEIEEQTIYQYLSAIHDSVILKDVIKRNNIRDVALLEKIIQFVYDNISNIFSARKVAEYFKNERRAVGHETVLNYLNYLDCAFIIKKIPRFDLKGKKILEINEKHYAQDLGLRHALLGYKEKDINAYLENIILNELIYRGYNVNIGKLDDYEVDFVATKRNEKLYIQVSYLLNSEKVREREYRPFYMINDNYPKYLLTLDEIPESTDDGIIRKYLPSWLIEKSI